MSVAETTTAVPVLARPDGPISERRLLADLIALTRPLQWTKNILVVLLALAATPQWSIAALGRLAWSALVFTLAATTVYVANDIADRHRDRLHPQKRNRPIASGRVDLPTAVLFCGLLAGLLAAAMAVGPSMGYWPVLVYLVLNAAYSRGLKHVPLIEVGIVAAGFVLRLSQGTLASGAGLSMWLLLATFSLCLVLILGKRRAELLAAGPAHRPALRGYSVAYLDQLIQLCCGLTAVAGLLYLTDEAALGRYETVATLLCIPFVLFGLSRYLQALVIDQGGGDPVRALLTDRRLAVAAALWSALFAGVLVLARNPELASFLLP
jgi:decaprenyl-phosphate phosphoribosyltransferase